MKMAVAALLTGIVLLPLGAVQADASVAQWVFGSSGVGNDSRELAADPLPEPAAALLTGAALMGIGMARRRSLI